MQSFGRFIAGEKPKHILLYHGIGAGKLPDQAAKLAHDIEDGHVMVLPAAMAQEIADKVLIPDLSTFSERSRERGGAIESFLTAGTCPEAMDNGKGHTLEQIFAFVQPKDELLGGIYAKGDVMHAYALCSCQTYYSDRWVVDH